MTMHDAIKGYSAVVVHQFEGEAKHPIADSTSLIHTYYSAYCACSAVACRLIKRWKESKWRVMLEDTMSITNPHSAQGY